MKGAAALVAKLLHGSKVGDVSSALPAVLAVIPGDARRALAATVDVLAGADVLGPRPVSGLYAPLFTTAAALEGLPPHLLEAVAAVLTDFEPAYAGPERVGIMGLPRTRIMDGRHTAGLSELIARDQDAAAAVRRNVETAARYLASLAATNPHGLAGALVLYVEAGGFPPQMARTCAGTIGAAMLYYNAREIAPELQRLREAVA